MIGERTLASWTGLWLPVLMAFVLGAGCASKPTTVQDNPERKMEGAEKIAEPIVVRPETAVVDARPRFDYSIAHVPRSVSLIWTDFSEPEVAGVRGLLQKDLFAATRRLARLGIGPTTPVVVVGRGREGVGEEGRIAWMLAYLGIKQVQFADINSFKAKLVNTVEETAPQSVPMWKPETVDSLLVERDEIKFVINKRGVQQPIRYRGRDAVVYRIIDVRDSKDYLGRAGLGADKHVPNMDAVNIPWREFFTADLRPQRAMAEKLKSVGILPEHRIIVLDHDGVASGAVTMALRGIGFSNAGNYAGGLAELLGRPQ